MQDHPYIRRTKIICTIGPSSFDPEVLTALCDNGMNIARLNFSHGDVAQHQRIIDAIRAYNECHEKQVAIMLDTKGAEIRTGDVQDPIEISAGDTVVFSSTGTVSDASSDIVIEVSYDNFAKDVVETETILIDNGELSFDSIEVLPDGNVKARAKENGIIGTRRHINLPGADIDLPSITTQDWDDLRFGATQNIDYLALSFIRNADEVAEVRALLTELNSTSQIISKIETQKGVQNIKEIIDVSDAIMVARGDLGADIPFEELPAVQDEIVCRCKDAGKPVIIATHMLESMKEHPMPTRAEVTDTAHAVATEADATMLSGETASGTNPLLALQAMVRIHTATEQHLSRLETTYDIRFQDSAEEEMDSAVTLAEKEGVDAIVVITESGRTAKHLSKFRPKVPIIALVSSREIQRSLLLHFGVHPLNVKYDTSDDVTIETGISLAQKEGLLHKGQKILQLKDRANAPEITVL